MFADTDVEKALNYLADTDTKYGEAVGRVAGLEHRIKAAKAMEFLAADVKTVAEKEAISVSSVAVQKLTNEYENAVAERETMRAKRKRAELVIEVYRTQQANQRVGHV